MNPIDPAGAKRTLVFERGTALTPQQLWQAWTTPGLITQWFAPAPWKTIACEIDLRPGGLFSTTMQSPDGRVFPNIGCYLELVPHQRLVWTNALAPGFWPLPEWPAGPCITAVLSFEPAATGTLYRATVLHRNEDACKAHADMGFQDGWGKAFEQLVAAVRNS